MLERLPDDPTHPLWAIASATVIVAFTAIVLYFTATTPDMSEVRSGVLIAAAAFMATWGKEALARMTARKKADMSTVDVPKGASVDYMPVVTAPARGDEPESMTIVMPKQTEVVA